MEIQAGHFYFVSDTFFEIVQDEHLKINKNTGRPHYFAVGDTDNGLYWLVPCSSRIEKFEGIIQHRRAQHKPTDAIQIVKVFGKRTALLFQDMFPVSLKYLSHPYIKGGQPVRIADPKVLGELDKTARKIIKLLRKGVRFAPTPPDVSKIERIMREELKREAADAE